MSSLPWKAQIYIVLITALAASAVLFSMPIIGKDLILLLAVFVASVAIAILDAFPVSHIRHIEITISNSVKFAILLLNPPAVVILAALVGTALYELKAKRTLWIKKVFNVSQMVVTWTVVAWVYSVFYQAQFDYFGSAQNAFAIIIAGLVNFAVNTTLVCLVVSLAMKLPFRYVWLRNNGPLIWHELSLIPLGVFLAVLWRFNPVSIILGILPLEVVRRSYKTVTELQNQTQQALRALMRVIDERDHHTMDHSERVSSYARSIADELDLPQGDVDTIGSAALVHDLGKVGMADDILFNPKILNPQERSHAQKHAEVGAILLAKFPLFDKGAVLVKHHHERYDGTGYPDGLKGEKIPLGSRIISVADAYQAMTEDRPYRRALLVAEAIAQLRAGSGTQFDPRVVQAFVQVLEKKSSVEEPIGVVAPQLIEAESTR